MKFKIIPNEQTPEVPINDYEEYTNQFIKDNYKLLTKFLSFASRQYNCVGLSANQVSVDGNRIMERFFAIKENNVWDLVINPKVGKLSGISTEKEEGCLTWLGKTLIARRYKVIDVEYTNLKCEKIKRTLFDFTAQIFQHEYDHLNGVKEIFKNGEVND